MGDDHARALRRDQDERSLRLRFHTQTGGVTLTAQQPENNIVRVALQGFAAVCGGTQSLHTNGFDEALALPTERAAKIALRTQQIIAHESGATDTVDPFAGSYYVEALTDEIEARAGELIAKVDELGGSVNAIEFITGEIDESAWGYQERYRIEQDVVVGVNRYVDETEVEVPDLLRVDPESERTQLERLKAFKADRDQELVQRRLEELRDAARGTDNLLPAIKQALRDRASMGEVCGAMQDVFGAYAPTVLDARLRRRPGAHRVGIALAAAAGGREVLTAVGTAVAGSGAVVGVAAAFWIIGRSEDREREREAREREGR